MEDWNDLRLVLAVARAQSLTRAAKALGIDHSTAFRRLNALEAKIGARLFERLPGGVYRQTGPGERMTDAAERMESEALALTRDIEGQDRRLTGRLRVTSSETLAQRQLPRALAAFRRAHPGITVELVVDNRVLSLSRREADIALRPVRPRESDLWGRKFADIAWALYASRDWLAEHGIPDGMGALSSLPIIGWDEAATGIAAARWLAETVPDEAVVFRSSSLVNQFAAARVGIGIALLPCYLGDAEPDIARAVPEPISALAAELWIVTHQDLKATARVRAFFDVVGEELGASRRLFAGDEPATIQDAKASQPP